LAIERVQRLELVFPSSRRQEVLAQLHAAEMVHVDEPPEELLEAGAERVSVSTEEIDDKISALSAALEVCELHPKPKRGIVRAFIGFCEGCFGLLPPATPGQLAQAAREVDVASAGKLASQLQERWRGLGKTETEAKAEMEILRPYVGLSFSGRDLQSLKTVRVVFGRMTSEKFNALRLDLEAETLAWEEARRERNRVLLMVAFRPADSTRAWEKLREHGFEETPLPELDRTVDERIAALHAEVERVDREREEVRAEAGQLAGRAAEIRRALAYWEDQRELREAAAQTAEVGRSGLLLGWVRERDLAAFKSLLKEKLPFCSASFREPLLEEEPPVSIRLPGPLKPMQLLVNMFGAPEYRSFDPTSYLAIGYLVFFGCCFGDVVYGLALCAISLYVMRRYARSWVKGFFQFFLYAGVFSILFGLLTGTWMGDLVSEKYLSPQGVLAPLLNLRDSCKLMDPLDKPLLALLVSLALGILNQFYGIVLKMCLEIRRRDYASAVFDAGLWLVFLPGLILAITPMFYPLPGTVVTVAYWLLGVSALGLVLTQGRKEKGVVAKGITGVVSLYGILGSYGATSFVGDVLSYSRLLALGLTTTIIAVSVNILANMVKDIPWGLGVVAFAVIFFVGHAGNFIMSILGAFVHPARLVLLEFFNRFYESGGRRFTPLGPEATRVEIIRNEGV
jgi:V/A-type H+-transporting ATPase subunit I